MSGEGTGAILVHQGSASSISCSRDIPPTVWKARHQGRFAGRGRRHFVQSTWAPRNPLVPVLLGWRPPGHRRLLPGPWECQETRGETGVRDLLHSLCCGGSTALDGVPPATRGSRGHVCPRALRVTRPGRRNSSPPCSSRHTFTRPHTAKQLCVIFPWSEGARGSGLLLDLAASPGAPSTGPRRPAERPGGAWWPGPRGPFSKSVEVRF